MFHHVQNSGHDHNQNSTITTKLHTQKIHYHNQTPYPENPLSQPTLHAQNSTITTNTPYPEFHYHNQIFSIPRISTARISTATFPQAQNNFFMSMKCSTHLRRKVLLVTHSVLNSCVTDLLFNAVVE